VKVDADSPSSMATEPWRDTGPEGPLHQTYCTSVLGRTRFQVSAEKTPFNSSQRQRVLAPRREPTLVVFPWMGVASLVTQTSCLGVLAEGRARNAVLERVVGHTFFRVLPLVGCVVNIAPIGRLAIECVGGGRRAHFARGRRRRRFVVAPTS